MDEEYIIPQSPLLDKIYNLLKDYKIPEEIKIQGEIMMYGMPMSELEKHGISE